MYYADSGVIFQLFISGVYVILPSINVSPCLDSFSLNYVTYSLAVQISRTKLVYLLCVLTGHKK